MSLKTLDDLFEDTLRDVYYAEKKLVKTLPKMAKKASNEELAHAFTSHREETVGQVERLEQVFQIIGKAARGKTCEAINGIVEEGASVMEEAEDDTVLDAGLLAAAQAVEHYEIARYGALIGWAKQLNLHEAASLLEENLQEENAAAELLTRISKAVTPAAHMAEAA